MRKLRRICLTVIVVLASQSALASELLVLTAGAFRPVVGAALPPFEEAQKARVSIDNDTVGALLRRIGGGAAFDVAILTPEALDRLAAEGKLSAGTQVALARVGIGLAVRLGAPAPPIGDVAGFRAALLAAGKVAYLDPAAGGSSGIYLSGLFDRLGIGAQMRAKAVLVPGGLVASRVVDGQADLAIHQISELLAVPGVRLVGPIPAELQNYTVYAGAISAQSHAPALARAFLAALTAPSARQMLTQKGMETVP